MRIPISNSSSDPIYKQIKREIRRRIVIGELKDGDVMPSIRQLAFDLQVSVITTKRAYDDLADEGLLLSAPGKGTFVSAKSRVLIKEKKLSQIETKLGEAVTSARLLGVKNSEIKQILSLLLKDE